MNKYKRGKAAPFNLFAILFVCRLIVAFTASTGFITGKYSPDILISFAISIIFILLISLPIIYAVNNGKNIFNCKWLSAIYGIYFIYVGSVNVSRFSYFAATTLEPQNRNVIIFAAILIVACTYAAALGIEAISRFASFVFIIVILGVISIIVLSLREFSVLNLFPFSKNSAETIISNSISFTADTSEILLLPILSQKINGKKTKPFYFGIILSVLTMMLLIFFAIGAFGDAANLSAYPIFAMSQISTFQSFERLDSVYMAFWIFAAFLKTAVYIYAASLLFKTKNSKTSCILSGVVMLIASSLILSNNYFAKIEKAAIIIPFLIFGFVIPILSLIFHKKNKGEKLLENF